MEGFRYLSEQDQLGELYAQMAATDTYALDTEFIKVNTLWPYLGLLQINVDGQVYLLDGQSLDLSDLWLLVFNARQNIFHASGEDLDLIHHYAGQKDLENLFDTQVGLAFLGHGLQVSYQQALQQELGIHVDKGETRSDWLARPLRPEQMQYAANDVIHLPQLANKIREQLQHRGLWDWTLEDCRTYALDVGAETPLVELYQDVGNFRHSRKQLAQLQQLCVWREQIARATNQPRSFILKNSTLIDLLDQQPMNAYQLQKIRDLRPHVLREHGKTILDLLHYLPDESQWPLRLPRPYRQKNNDLLDRVQQYTEQLSQEIQVPSEVLLRKRWINALLTHVACQQDEADLPRWLLGWRYDMLTRPILEIMQQQRDMLMVEMAPVAE
ncbi:MAG: HRDC domain-containing protein [Pseudomonadota bacterium]|nr:HRDC domain-containing protein [Pseudomonadota bacterium]